MATAASRDVGKQLSNIVECSVCTETYSDPRQLPCIHTYCLKCIRKFSRDKLPGDDVACPLCRKIFHVPEEGIDSLPKNFFMEQLKELASPLSTHCEVCSKSETKAAVRKTATMFCMDCNERLCETCANIHRQMKVSRGHELVKEDGNDESSERKVRMTRVYCGEHPDEVLKLYCFNCKTAICMMCFAQSHQMHKCSDINVVADEFRREITGNVEGMVNTVARCREGIEGERRNREKFNRTVKEIEREICDRVDKLKQLIDREKSNILKELDSFKMERNKQIDNVIQELEQRISFVESLRTYTEQLLDKGRSGDITQQRSSIQDRADQLMKLDGLQRTVDELGSVDVTFTAVDWSSSSGDILGKISKNRSKVKYLLMKLTTSLLQDNSGVRLVNTTSSQTQRPLLATTKTVDNSSDPVAVNISTSSRRPKPKPVPDKSSGSSQVLHLQQATAQLTAETSLSHVISADDRGAVQGVTVWNEKLFVLRGKSEQKIEQFNVKTFQQLNSIAVKGLSDDVTDYWWYKSLTLCNINNCMYINDVYKVFRVDLSTENVISWPVDGHPVGLSVNGTRNVLVTCHGDHSIKEFSSRGSFVRSIKLQVNHVKYPRHCIQLTDGRYVVSHVGPVQGVSEIDEHGTLIATYRNSKTTKLKMDLPLHIILFNNSLLVADMRNNRILLLNSSLSDARPLSLPVNSQLSRPFCMYLEQSRGRLFVGELSGRVLVFDNINANY